MTSDGVLDPILCFARDPRQTPDEVFDMLQERMMTLLGRAYSEKGVGVCNWVPEDQADKAELAAISDWQASSIVMDTDDFDRLGARMGLSMADVLGRPRMTARQRDAVMSVLANDGSVMRSVLTGKEPTIDPATALVTFSVFDRIDEIARERRAMAETQKETA